MPKSTLRNYTHWSSGLGLDADRKICLQQKVECNYLLVRTQVHVQLGQCVRLTSDEVRIHGSSGAGAGVCLLDDFGLTYATKLHTTPYKETAGVVAAFFESYV